MLIEAKPAGRAKKASLRSREIRASLQALVDGQTEHLGEWIRQTAQGIPQTDSNGNVKTDSNGCTIWLNKPNPEAAVKLVSDLAEYVVPKLSRADVAVAARVEHQHLEPGQMDANQLQRALLEQLGIGQQPIEGEIIDVTPEPVPAEMPDWLK